MDGVTTHHMGQRDHEKTVNRTVDLVFAYSRQPTVKNKAAVYNHIMAEQVVSIIDPVIEALVGESSIRQERLYELARSFVVESPDREPVKFGIALLGLFRQPADKQLFQILGRHEEFTLFCAVAIANSTEDADEALWALARNVNGWGRIHAVERLARTENPEIKRWLLCEGFRNSVMYEYLAATCARGGDLLAAVSENPVEPEVLNAAGEIIQALISGGPSEGIDDYEDAQPVIEGYLQHMATSAETVADFLSVNSVRGFLEEDDSRWAARYDAGWTVESRARLRSLCDSIIGRPEWAGRVRADLASQDEAEFAQAAEAAKALGISTWDVHWRRLRENATDSGRWYPVMMLCDENRIAEVIEFAESRLDLSAIATGAGNELVGMGCGFEPHNCLQFVLQDLGRFPRRGAKLIDAGLKSPVVRNRNTAAGVLAAWSRDKWSDELGRSLQQAAECEPNEGVRKRMRQALSGETLSP